MGLSILLIGLGFWQQRCAKQCNVRGRMFGAILLWSAVVVVAAMILFPGQISAFIADHFYERGR